MRQSTFIRKSALCLYPATHARNCYYDYNLLLQAFNHQSIRIMTSFFSIVVILIIFYQKKNARNQHFLALCIEDNNRQYAFLWQYLFLHLITFIFFCKQVDFLSAYMIWKVKALSLLLILLAFMIFHSICSQKIYAGILQFSFLDKGAMCYQSSYVYFILLEYPYLSDSACFITAIFSSSLIIDSRTIAFNTWICRLLATSSWLLSW